MKHSLLSAWVLVSFMTAVSHAAMVTFPAVEASAETVETAAVPGRFMSAAHAQLATIGSSGSLSLLHPSWYGGCGGAEKPCGQGIWDGFCNEKRGFHGFALPTITLPTIALPTITLPTIALPAITLPQVRYQPLTRLPRLAARHETYMPGLPEIPCVGSGLGARFSECRARLTDWVRDVAGWPCQDCGDGEAVPQEPLEASEEPGPAPTAADARPMPPQLDPPSKQLAPPTAQPAPPTAQPAPPADSEVLVLPDYQADTATISHGRSAQYWLLPPLWSNR